MQSLIRTLYMSVPVFVFDQLSKVWVVHGLDLITLIRIPVFPPFLTFQMAWNRGVNFGLLANDAELGRWILIAVSVAISGALLWWGRRQEGWRVPLAIGAIVGGALGNAIDRIVYGAVADFLNMSCCGIRNPFSFNIADVAIFAGAIALIFMSGKETKQESDTKSG